MSNLDHSELIYYLVAIKRNFIHFCHRRDSHAPVTLLVPILDNEEAMSKRSQNVHLRWPPSSAQLPASIAVMKLNEPFILGSAGSRHKQRISLQRSC